METRKYWAFASLLMIIGNGMIGPVKVSGHFNLSPGLGLIKIIAVDIGYVEARHDCLCTHSSTWQPHPLDGCLFTCSFYMTYYVIRI